jgi:hypothetical protein
VSAPTEALGLVPNWDRRPGERADIRPHGTEARAMRHRRRGEKPCPACLAAENAAHAYRRAVIARRSQKLQLAERNLAAMNTPEPDAEAEADWLDEWDDADSAAYHARVEAGLEPEAEL